MTTEAATERQSSASAGVHRPKVFISYSRKDVSFVDQIESALQDRGIVTLVDRMEIYAFEDWWDRIQSLITASDTVVFVLSPDAVMSSVCLQEVEFACSLSKRFAPIVWRPVDAEAVPKELSRLNFIFFDQPDRFSDNLERLVDALTIDIGWIRNHTAFGAQARQWSLEGKPSGLLLRPPALEAAESWISVRPNDAPMPTDDTRDFILQSRQAFTRRRSILTTSLFAGLVLTAGLAGAAFWQRKMAIEQRDRALISESYFLTDRSRAEAHAGNMTTASLYALAALPDAKNEVVRPVVPAAKYVLLSSVHRLRDMVLRAHQSSGREAPVQLAAMSPDGTRVLSLFLDKTARLWDAITGELVATFGDRDNPVSAAGFSADGRHVMTGSPDGSVRLLDGRTGAQIVQVNGDAQEVLNIVVSPSGDYAATTSADGKVLIRNGRTLEPIRTLALGNGGVTALAFSGDGNRLIAGCGSGVAVLWNVPTWSMVTTLQGHGDRVTKVAFSENGKTIATASADKNVKLWDGANGSLLGTLSGHDDEVLDIAFSPDGLRLVSASTDGTARLWDVGKSALIAELPSNGPVVSASFSGDGKNIATASADKMLRLWNGITGKERATFQGHSGAINSVTFSADSKRMVSGSHDATVRIWDLSSGEGSLRVDGSDSRVLSVAFSVSGDVLAAASADGTLASWDSEAGRTMALTAQLSHVVTFAGISPDSARMVASIGETPELTDPAAPNVPIKLVGHDGNVVAANFNADGTRIVTASWDRSARIWDARTGASLATLTGHEKEVSDARFSADGRRIVTASWDATARIWDSRDGRLLMTLPAQSVAALRLATFSPDGLHVATASQDNVIRIWNLARHAIVATLTGHQADISSVEFSPDGQSIVTSSEDETVRLWDAGSGAELLSLQARAGKAWTARFNFDGTRIAAGYSGGRIVIWNLFSDIQDLVRLAQQSVKRCLHGAERAEAHLTSPIPSWCAEKSAPSNPEEKSRPRIDQH